MAVYGPVRHQKNIIRTEAYFFFNISGITKNVEWQTYPSVVDTFTNVTFI
jgi:hypothetical protein